MLYQLGKAIGNKTLSKAATLINTNAIATAFDTLSARPVWPNDTRAIIPKVNTPMPPRVNACKAREGNTHAYADKAVNINPRIIQP